MLQPLTSLQPLTNGLARLDQFKQTSESCRCVVRLALLARAIAISCGTFSLHPLGRARCPSQKNSVFTPLASPRCVGGKSFLFPPLNNRSFSEERVRVGFALYPKTGCSQINNGAIAFPSARIGLSAIRVIPKWSQLSITVAVS